MPHSEEIQGLPALWPREETPSFASTDDAWPAIDSSWLTEDDSRPVLPPIPLDLLPSAWRDWVNAAAGSASTPPDYVVQAVLAVVAGLAGAGVRVVVKP